MNSSRPAFSIAARTPTPWSSSWFQRASISGAAWSRLDAAFSPPSTVKSAGDAVVDVEAALVERVLEALAAVLGQRQRVDAGDLGDHGVRLVAELLADVGAGGDAHAVVVAEDGDARGVRVVELAVDVDDRDAGLHRLEGDRGHGRAVEGQQHDRVDALVDERLDLADLQVDVVGALRDPELDVVVRLGGLLGGLGDRAHPAVVGGRGGEADDDLVARLVVRAGLGRGGAAARVVVALGGGVAGAGCEGEDGQAGDEAGSELLLDRPQGHGGAPCTERWCWGGHRDGGGGRCGQATCFPCATPAAAGAGRRRR